MLNRSQGAGCLILISFLLAAAGVRAGSIPISLDVDATDAPRNLLHARLHIPAGPGPLTLYYPQWIPGEHGPTGPLNDLTGLAISAGGQRLDWHRDAVDLYAFQLSVPAGADSVEVAFDFLLGAGDGAFSSGGSATPRLLDLNWNQLLLYPAAKAPLGAFFAASLKLPSGWQYGTALPLASAAANKLSFAPVPLETLIDSPVIAGQFFATVPLTPGESVPYFLHVAADRPEDLAANPPATVLAPQLVRLVREENALFGAHHYRDYHFLLTVSEQVAHFGLEHHESSDDRVGANFLTDADARRLSAELLPHEMFHSWNGKYRRPAGLATPDYQQPMRDELLWIYEGLTSYYGKVLAARSGLESAADFRDALALNAAMLDHRFGRQWRSLSDTAVSASLLYVAPGGGVGRRRGVDFYTEGDLIWLEADTLIRRETHGQKSLDDFCRKFHGGQNSGPQVVPYVYDDVVRTLNEVLPYPWHDFFQQRVYALTEHAPLGGLANAGWRLAWTNSLPPFLKLREDQRKFTDLNYSLGFTLDADGGIGDVQPGSPADRAGLVQGLKLLAVNGRAWTATLLRTAVADAATNHAPITLLTLSQDYYQTLVVEYHGGEKYPFLERNPASPDLLAGILQPLVPPPPPPPAKP